MGNTIKYYTGKLYNDSYLNYMEIEERKLSIKKELIEYFVNSLFENKELTFKDDNKGVLHLEFLIKNKKGK